MREALMKQDQQSKRNSESVESESESGSDLHYILKLYITGTTPSSSRAVVNIRKLCEEHLSGRYTLEVIDIRTRPDLAKEHQLLAAPTLIKSLPLPIRRFIGDMSETGRLVVGLELDEA